MNDQPAGGSNEGRLIHRSPRDLLQRMGRLVRKEVSTILRDRRTIITLVLMPLLLYPLLTIGFRQFLLAGSLHETKEPDYRIGFRSEAEAQGVNAQITAGKRVLTQHHEKARSRRGDAERSTQEVAGSSNGPDKGDQKTLPNHQSLTPRDVNTPSNLEALLRDQSID